MGKKKLGIDGNDLLYRLLQELLDRDDESSVELIQLIIQSYAVWFPPSLYSKFPVVLPWVVRDAKCRPHAVAGSPGEKTHDEWGSPNSDGFQRDDNSLIKALKSTLKVSGPKGSLLDDKTLANGFVACHVWREVRLEELASRDPRLNSFIPNLVWLPKQIAKLSDHEGGTVQEALKKTSREIYQSTAVDPAVQPAVDAIWNLLPHGKSRVDIDQEKLHWFVVTDSYIDSRMKAINRTLDFCDAISTGRPFVKKGKISTRYFEGLPLLGSQASERVAAQIRLTHFP
jgi:hypothetical protein